MSATAPPALPSSPPPAPSTSLNDAPPPPTCWDSLPVELKALVVKHVHRLVNVEAKTVWAWHDAMCSLSRVNKEFNDLCIPHLYETVEVLGRPNSAYLRLLISSALPRHGRHVKTLCLRPEEGKNDWCKEGSKKPRAKPSWGFFDRIEHDRRVEMFEQALKVAEMEDANADERLFPDDTRSLLNIAALRMCTSLRKLEWEDVVTEPEEERLSTNFFFRALGSTAGPSLTSLSIDTASTRPIPHLLAFLEACPNVEKLSVKIRLTSLTVHNDDGQWELSFDAFRSFCATSGSSLQHLHMDAVFDSAPYRERKPAPLRLPSLTRVAWRDGSDENNLAVFLASPIKRIEILHDGYSGGAPDLLDDLKKHAKTLEEVFIASIARLDPSVWPAWDDDTDDPDGQGISDNTIVAIQAWGKETGVDVEVEERRERGGRMADVWSEEEEVEDSALESEGSLGWEDEVEMYDSEVFDD
ncbi:hypothetical protein JCM6882_004762 [Rhodosporidiobolus microsporus]